ncbi:MAG: oligosaccharide flippase family protein [Fermentimonas sp.]|nr:oligosaccharide flippase family protein [Fermentimonas sp.]
MTEEKGYKNIFKTTFLFGFVQVFNILVKVGTNKAVALFLGAEGMGIIGLFNSAIGMLKTGAGLGVSQSAVRDISEANACKDDKKLSRIISLTNKVIIITSLLGILITLVLSPFLSKWSFGNNHYTIAFVWISIVVGLNILSEGQLSILKGMRQLRALAKASMIGSLVGLITAVPFYYFFGKGGIVPSLIITAFSALFFSNYFVRRIKYDRIKLTWREVYSESSLMVKMGSALMFSSFLASFSALVISSYIRRETGLADVGFYNAGTAIMTGYFGVIITALSTDYYPRIAAVNKDNVKLQSELNKQSLVSLILTGPIIVLFLFLLPFFVTILYSSEFLPIVDFVKIGIFGTLITIVSNQVDMILVAKFNIKVFTIISVIYRVIQVLLSIVLYKYFGLIGMGFTLMLLGVIHLLIMTITVNKLYKIRFNKLFIKIALVVLLFTISAIFISEIDNLFFRYSIGVLLFVSSCLFSLYILKKHLNMDFVKMLNNKYNR